MSFLCIFTRAFAAYNVTKFYTRSFICICCDEFYFYWFYARSTQRVCIHSIFGKIHTTHVRPYESLQIEPKTYRSAVPCPRLVPAEQYR